MALGQAERAEPVVPHQPDHREAAGVDVGADPWPLDLPGPPQRPLRARSRPSTRSGAASAASRVTAPGAERAPGTAPTRSPAPRDPVGTGNPASNRSRTNQLMPPQRPAEASPMPIQRGSIGPSRTVGPGGKRLANRRPWVLGRKPGTAFDSRSHATIRESAANEADSHHGPGYHRRTMGERTSAGILLYRRTGASDTPLEVLLAHPGGPYFAKRDLGDWTIPKGEPDGRARSPRRRRAARVRGGDRDGDRRRGAHHRAGIDRPEGRQDRPCLGGRGRPGSGRGAFE